MAVGGAFVRLPLGKGSLALAPVLEVDQNPPALLKMANRTREDYRREIHHPSELQPLDSWELGAARLLGGTRQAYPVLLIRESLRTLGI